jgi:hypothetical protein
MPLYADGLRKIRRNLFQIQDGVRLKVQKVGFFTAEQLTLINEARASIGLSGLCPEIVFHGRHLYNSRCVEIGYTIDQVLEQIQSAFSDASVLDFSSPSTVIRNPNKRMDHDGIPVNDEVVFECTGRHPNADLYSAVPRGDGRLKPRNAKGPLEE